MARHLIPNDTAIRSIKPGDARKRLSDGDGLYLLLFVKGASHGWRLDYSIAGKRKTLSLGTYPDTGLSLARRKADEARKLVSEGTDPSDVRKATKAQQQAAAEAKAREDDGLPPINSFEAVAREWLDTVHRAKVSEGHADRTLIRFEQDAFPWIGRTSIDSVTAKALLSVLRRVESRGAIETAHRLKDACGQVFRYAIATERCERNPAADLRDALKPYREKHFAAMTEPKRVGELLRAIDAYTGFPTTRAALQLAPLRVPTAGQPARDGVGGSRSRGCRMDDPGGEDEAPDGRQGERRGACRTAVASGRGRAARYQAANRAQPLRVPERARRRPAHVQHDRERRIAAHGLRYEGRHDGHGFRAMARTMLAERLHVAPEVIEAQLAHAVKDSLGRAYNRTQFAEQRRALMQQWADYLDRLRDGADVLPFPTKAA